MKKKKKLHDGKTKKLYSLEESDQLIQEFKDDAMGFEASSAELIKGKGIINKDISCYLFHYLEGFHIPTHYVKDLGGREMLVRRLEMIPLEIAIRNIVAGSLTQRFGLEAGKELNYPIIEFYLKDEQRNNPMINPSHAIALQLATPDEIRVIERLTSKINAVLKSFFQRRNYRLVDLALEFGRAKDKLVLGDEISLNTFRLSEAKPGADISGSEFQLLQPSNEMELEEIKKRIFQPS
ncbi:MAG: phosphoribosylaminoimidazolesuccinocarboxamide synthase [candidate division KSB1 bacterium]|nr:phosphoribosylaminoimidazolesuccinocarboxamide synthase [candidate division KSB1 bacterium]MDZ7335397.1 phosphoribosylaminoimidazolesuccinocarboxamide synthase [candidate division KSB1 bacterium]MDZ7356423.1 phosphoribosylaminoimidazolesuccinocarboxamide synthase [candidate division KSB1 bacterium]MDZ7401194.1 phosphoribosylaminoimidazolesuccinocarboxamide synthase [candidate division KSB1 bacterium]